MYLSPACFTAAGKRVNAPQYSLSRTHSKKHKLGNFDNQHGTSQMAARDIFAKYLDLMIMLVYRQGVQCVL